MGRDEDNKKEEGRTKEMIMEIVTEYSEISTIAGLVYIFMPEQSLFGKLYWLITILLMIALGTYWSAEIYIGWVEQQVLTTASTTALPVGNVTFPAVTICAEGFNYQIFHAALFKLFFVKVGNEDYLQIPAIGTGYKKISSFYAAELFTAESIDTALKNLTKEQLWDLNRIDDYIGKNWDSFIKNSFPGLNTTVFKSFRGLDAMIQVYGLTNPDAYLRGSSIASNMPTDAKNSLLEYLMDPSLQGEVDQFYNKSKSGVVSGLNSMDFSVAFESLLRTLWYSKLPCFDIEGLTAERNGWGAMLKNCYWKQMPISCSAIFKTFPTDRGMCCSFNMEKAEDIFVDSIFTNVTKHLQSEDSQGSFDDSTLPDWYNNAKEPNTQAGINMGLTVMIDAHTDLIEAFSIDTDFDSFTALVTPPGDFPLTYQSGFRLMRGFRNMVALSAIQISADEGIRGIVPDARNCLFEDENTFLKLHNKYSQANCFLECSLFYAQEKYENITQQKACTPWSFPIVNKDHVLCDPWQSILLTDLLQNDIPEEKCKDCRPDCNRVIYQHTLTTEPFRPCDEKNFGVSEYCNLDLAIGLPMPQIWGTQVLDQLDPAQKSAYSNVIMSSQRQITSGVSLMGKYIFTDIERNYDAYEKDIAVLTVYFDTPTVLQFGTQETQQWVDYFANVGGLLGLCIGLSIITVIELVWLSIRILTNVFMMKYSSGEISERNNDASASAWD